MKKIALLVIFCLFSVLQLQAQETKDPDANTKWTTTKISEAEFRKYFDKNKDNLDPIEGIYNLRTITSGYNFTHSDDGLLYDDVKVISEIRLALINCNAFSMNVFSMNAEPSYEYVGIVLESDYPEWTPGRFRLFIRKTGFNDLFESKLLNSNVGFEKKDFTFSKIGKLHTEISEGYISGSSRFNQLLLLRIYPQIENTKKLEAKTSQNGDKALKGTASGFLISNSGLIVTNYHVVVDGSKFEIAFPSKGITKKAKVKMKDIQNDIAILEIENFSLSEISDQPIPYTFADNSTVKVGQETFTLGFPLGDIMGTTPRLATGNINSLYGLEDDPRLYQINNPLQPGNSGGALLNKKGEIVGICVSGLNAKFFYENAGIIPQNMNFAIKANYLINLIGMLPESDEILKRANTVKQGTLEEQIEQINPFVVQIRVY